MIDLKMLRNQLEAVAKRLAESRGFELDIVHLKTLEETRKTLQIQVEALQNKRNQSAKKLGQQKAAGLDIRAEHHALKQSANDLKALETELAALQEALNTIYLTIPNLLHESVPYGKDSSDNRIERRWGDVPTFDFDVKDHVTLGNHLKQLDMARAAKLSGARFSVLYGGLARLHRALIQWMLDTHTARHGYEEVYVPYLVNQASLYGTGQLPKFGEDQFCVAGSDDLTLIPTGEVPVTNLVRDEILPLVSLPIKWVAHTPCFRREVGSYGQEAHGLFRMHQFEKVELVQIVHPDHSYEALASIVGEAEFILQSLGLAYQVVTLCSGDTGINAAKTYDLEVYLPSKEAYVEVSSCSNFEAFQARRLKARFRDTPKDKPTFVHTLNGSGLAISRTLLAIMEHYQDEGGRIFIPPPLQPYMHQKTHLSVEETACLRKTT